MLVTEEGKYLLVHKVVPDSTQKEEISRKHFLTRVVKF